MNDTVNVRRFLLLLCVLLGCMPQGCRRVPPGYWRYAGRIPRLDAEEETFCRKAADRLSRGETSDTSAEEMLLFSLIGGASEAVDESSDPAALRRLMDTYIEENADKIVQLAEKRFDSLSAAARSEFLIRSVLSSRRMGRKAKEGLRKLLAESLHPREPLYVRITAVTLLSNEKLMSSLDLFTGKELEEVLRPYMHDRYGDIALQAALFEARHGDKKALKRLVELLEDGFRAMNRRPFCNLVGAEDYVAFCRENICSLFAEDTPVKPWFPAGWRHFIDENLQKLHWDAERRNFYLPQVESLRGGKSTAQPKHKEKRKETAIPLIRSDGIASSPDGRRLVMGVAGGRVAVVDTSRWRITGMLEGHSGEVRSVAVSPDGRTAASGDDEGEIRLWSLNDGRCLKVMRGHRRWVSALSFSRDGRFLASAARDGTVRIWKTNDGTCVRIVAIGVELWSVTTAGDGRSAFAGDDEGKIHVLSIPSGRRRAVIEAHTGRVTTLHACSTDACLLSGGADGLVKSWNTSTWKCTGVFRGHRGGITAVTAVGAVAIASGGTDATIRIWDATSGRCVHVLRGHTDWIKGLLATPDGATLISAGWDNMLRVWNAADGTAGSIIELTVEGNTIRLHKCDGD